DFLGPVCFDNTDAGELVDGRLSVMGRLDAISDSGGLKLHAEVLEMAIIDLDGITGACVLGVPDQRLGQAIVAAYSGSLTPGEVIRGLADLPRWRLPKQLKHVEALPMVGPGKVDRRTATAPS